MVGVIVPDTGDLDAPCRASVSPVGVRREESTDADDAVTHPYVPQGTRSTAEIVPLVS